MQKLGGVGQQPPRESCKSVKHSSKMDSGIIWQIMKSGKSVKLYAKVGGVRQQHPCKSGKSVKHSSKMAFGGVGLEGERREDR